MESNTSATQKKQNEINLLELANHLWKSKALILLITTTFSLAGVAFSFFKKPTFESMAIIVPETNNGIAELQKAESLITKPSTITPEKAYAQFLRHLASNRYINSFLSAPEISQNLRSSEIPPRQLKKAFKQSLNVKIPQKKKVQLYNIPISLKMPTPELSSELLNKYINFAENLYIAELTNNSKLQIASEKNFLEMTIQSKKDNYRSALSEEINSLKEAITIAEEIGLTEPLETTNSFDKPLVVDQLRSLYHLGTKSLSAELKALEKRSENIQSIPGLTDEKLKLKLLSNVDIKTQSISVMTIDLAAKPNPNPSGPSKTVIVALSIILGLIIGILIAVIRISVLKQRL